MTDGGWSDSAEAWIARMGEEGDAGRRELIDPVVLARVQAGGFENALDVGCGEGRTCRALKARGVAAVGIDPTERLIECPRDRDPGATTVWPARSACPSTTPPSTSS